MTTNITLCDETYVFDITNWSVIKVRCMLLTGHRQSMHSAEKILDTEKPIRGQSKRPAIIKFYWPREVKDETGNSS